MKHQLGFSLIELIIALALSLFIAGATIFMYLGSRQTQVLNDEVNRLQENGRFALQILTENIRLAGYQGPGQSGSAPGHFLHEACGSFDPCTEDGGDGNSDRIAVQLNPPPDDGSEIDCTGATVPQGAVIANVYHITTTDNISSISCRGFQVTPAPADWLSDAQPLISGIDNMQIQYGLDSGGDGVRSFVSADRVGAGNWDQVAAVRIGLLANAGSTTGHGEASERDYVLLDADKLSFDDKIIRQVFTATAGIHNR